MSSTCSCIGYTRIPPDSTHLNDHDKRNAIRAFVFYTYNPLNTAKAPTWSRGMVLYLGYIFCYGIINDFIPNPKNYCKA